MRVMERPIQNRRILLRPVLTGKPMKSRTIWAAVVNTFNSGPGEVGTLGICREQSPRKGAESK